MEIQCAQQQDMTLKQMKEEMRRRRQNPGTGAPCCGQQNEDVDKINPSDSSPD
jgi:hypothetical protein